MDELELEVHGRKLKFIVHNRLWCELSLIENNNNIVLGGEMLDIILSKLLISFIPEKSRKHFVYKDMELFTIFCLMGPHAVVAGREVADCGLEMVFLSNKGEIIPLVTLSIEDIKEWINKLVNFMINYGVC